jgi:glycosyltransferase involved in cell wall biosynthesis
MGIETSPEQVEPKGNNREIESYEQNGVKDVPQGLRIGVLGNNRFYIKGYDLLIEIAKKIKLSGRPIKISLAGKDYEGDLASKIDQHEVGEIIDYVGEVDDSRRFLLEQDLFLLTSRVEGMPNSLIEAMSLGIPSISTKVGDLEVLFAVSEALRLCEIGDMESIFENICWCQDNWDKALAMGNRGKDAVRSQMGMASIQARLRDILEGFGFPS